MKGDAERAWYPKVNGRYLRISKRRDGLFVRPLSDERERPLTLRERLSWRLLRRLPKSM